MRVSVPLSLFLLLLSSCAAKSGVRADLSKLRPWSKELMAREPMAPPYVVDFEAGPKALTYIAVEHSNEASSASLQLVEKAMEARRYSVVLLEGIPRSLGLSPASIAESAKRDGGNGFYRAGETSVAVLKALRRAVPFVGGEPDEELVKANVLNAGFSMEDLFGFYIVRKIPQWRRDGTLSRGGFEEAFLEYGPSIGKSLGYAGGAEPSLESFHRWYQAKMGKPFRAREISNETVAPYAGGDLFTQKIAFITSRVRDEHIMRVTEELLNKYGKILMVFGSSHFPVQQLAIESMLGAPRQISDQP